MLHRVQEPVRSRQSSLRLSVLLWATAYLLPSHLESTTASLPGHLIPRHSRATFRLPLRQLPNTLEPRFPRWIGKESMLAIDEVDLADRFEIILLEHEGRSEPNEKQGKFNIITVDLHTTSTVQEEYSTQNTRREYPAHTTDEDFVGEQDDQPSLVVSRSSSISSDAIITPNPTRNNSIDQTSYAPQVTPTTAPRRSEDSKTYRTPPNATLIKRDLSPVPEPSHTLRKSALPINSPSRDSLNDMHSPSNDILATPSLIPSLTATSLTIIPAHPAFTAHCIFGTPAEPRPRRRNYSHHRRPSWGGPIRLSISPSSPKLATYTFGRMRLTGLASQAGMFLLLGLAVQRPKWSGGKGVRAAMVNRGNEELGGDPLLLTPPNISIPDGNDVDGDTPNSSSKTSVSLTSTTTSSSTKLTSIHTSNKSSSASSVVSSAARITSSAVSSAAQITSSALSSSSPQVNAEPPRIDPEVTSGRQPSNLRYLVPIFLMIILTLVTCVVTRYRSRRRRRLHAQAPSPSPHGTGWREIKSDEDDVDDPWYAGDENKFDTVSLETQQQHTSVAARGWGWKSTYNQWRSARGRMEEEGDGSVDEMGQKQTIKLVFPPSETYQSLAPPLPPAASNKGSIRALRDKLSTLTSSRKLLARTGAPNKRRLEPVVVPPPSAPEWIRPRAVSPTSQLSPPLQPHLFFHPTPSATSIHGVLGRTESESGSDYGSDDDVKNSSHMRLPTIPSTAEKLSESYTAVPRKSPRTKGVKRVQTLGGMSKDISPVKVKRSSTAAAATTPSAGLRRSIAIPDLSSPERIRVSKRKSTATSPRKSRVQRKEERARDKVESILQASWSDRALQSPPLQESRSIQGQLDAAAGQGWVAGVGMNSPGVEEAAGAGIEQRLGMLKRLEG